MSDITFIVHKDWLTAIEHLPVEQQDAIIGDFIRYGVEMDPAHADDGVVLAMVNLLKGKIDYSKEQYKKKVESGKNSGRKKKYTDEQIYELAVQYPDDPQKVAELLGCSKSTVQHSQGWSKRKEGFVVEQELDNNEGAEEVTPGMELINSLGL